MHRNRIETAAVSVLTKKLRAASKKNVHERLKWLNNQIQHDSGDNTATHLTELLAEHYDRLHRETDPVESFRETVRGPANLVCAFFVDRVKKEDTLFALSLFRSKPKVIGVKLFDEHYGELVAQTVLNKSCVVLDLLWPYMPIKDRKLFEEFGIMPDLK